MTDLAESLLIGLCLVTVVLSLLLWGMGIDRLVRGNWLIPWSHRRPVPWTLLDILALAFVGLGLIQAASFIVAKVLQVPIRDVIDPEMGAKYQIPVLIGFACASIATWLVGLILLRLRCGATSRDFGYLPLQLGTDIPLALVAFVMLIVPTLAIQYVATKTIPTKEQHPFIELIKENPDLRTLIPIALAAVVVAPVFEEFLFRVLLQSWFERTLKNLRARLAASEDEDRETTSVHRAPMIAIWMLLAALAHAIVVPIPDEAAVEDEGEATKTQWIPILMSGLLFGLAHLGHGPAPIALFFLGIGLGYLFQRTHRVLPCMIVHALVNSVAVAQLGIYISKASAP